MTMGLKIHKMMKDSSDPVELQEEARKRKDMSDSILEIIYNKIVHKRDRSPVFNDDEDENDNEDN